MPVDLLVGRAPDESSWSRVDYLDYLKGRLWKVHEYAREHMRLAYDRQSRYYNQKAHTTTYKTGDLVWLYQSQTKRGLKPKLCLRWTGPYKVMQKLSDCVYEIKLSPHAKAKVVHHNKLKPFVGQTDQWLDAVDNPVELDNLRLPNISVEVEPNEHEDEIIASQDSDQMPRDNRRTRRPPTWLKDYQT